MPFRAPRDTRFGGGWIDRTDPEHPVLGIAIVEPSSATSMSSVTPLVSTIVPSSWHAVKYSRAALTAFAEGLDVSSPAVFVVTWDARQDRVVVELARPDPAAESAFRRRIPDDALLFKHVEPECRAATL